MFFVIITPPGSWRTETVGGDYVDQRADDKQTDALAAIFSGAAGVRWPSFTPLISKNLGVKKVRSRSGSRQDRGRWKSLASAHVRRPVADHASERGNMGRTSPSGCSDGW